MESAPEPQSARRFGGLLFVVLCLAAFLGTDPGFSELAWQYQYVMDRSGPSVTAVYIGAYLAAAVGWALLMASRRTWIRWITTALTAVGLCVHLGVWAINGYGYELWEARMFFHEVAHAGDAATTFGAGTLGAVAAGFGITAALVLVRGWTRARTRFPAWLLLPLAAAPMTFVIARTDGEISAFPPPLKVPVVTIIGNLPRDVIGERRPPTLKPIATPLVPHVLFIIDESVRGDLLGINGGPPTTPWLSANASRLLNFGVACAATNSSAPSNMVIQSGIQPKALEKDAPSAMTMPNVFQYARAAGYRTSYLLGQPLRYWYYMNPSDLDDLDQLVQPPDIGRETPRHEIDRRMLDLAVKETARDVPTFTYLLKLGAHFPYGDKRPDGYWPLEETLFPDEPDEERREMLDDYARSLKYVVDDYFAALLPRLEGRDVIVVYTSDHGQSLLEGGIRATHGVGRNPPIAQANVPLFMVGTSERVRRLISARVGAGGLRLKGRATHFEIFPTLLTLMGYGLSDVEREYGPTLFTSDGSRERRFLSGDPFKKGARQMNAFDR